MKEEELGDKIGNRDTEKIGRDFCCSVEFSKMDKSAKEYDDCSLEKILHKTFYSECE